MAETAKNVDPYVLNVQKWVNEKFRGENGYTEIEENGRTGWNTIYALLHGLQITLEVGSTANNFGNGTINAFNAFIDANGPIKERTAEEDQELAQKTLNFNNPDREKDLKYKNQLEKINGIIQGALLCKGYAIGATRPTGNFYGGTASAIKDLKEDAGLSDTSSVATLDIMKALLSMDYFYSYDKSERTQNIINMQRYLNRNYNKYIGLTPCDGVYSRGTNKALIYAIQVEENMNDDIMNGNCGPTTRGALPKLLVLETDKEKSSGKDCNGNDYSSESLSRFKTLATMALYFNGFGSGVLENSLDRDTIEKFQSKYGIKETGIIDYTTWLSLLVSCGDTSRDAIACDCATIINKDNISVLVDNGIKYIGRYICGTIGNGISKALTTEELQLLFENGIRVFPIYQSSGNQIEYFTLENAKNDAARAFEAAESLNLQFGAIIYFAVDCDTNDYQISNYIIPYFKKLQSEFLTKNKGQYRIGIYGTRNTCTRVCEEGYACSSFVSDMSTGFSGNLGFPIPDNWAFDQFATVEIFNKNESQKIEIDKDGFSGKDLGIFHEYSISRTGQADNTNLYTSKGRVYVNRSNAPIPVYENKVFSPTGQIPEFITYGKKIGEIKANDMYLRYAVTRPLYDNVNKVLFNDGTDVKCGFITGKYLLSEDYFDSVLDYQEPFTCIHYNEETSDYSLESFNVDHEFTIKKTVPFFNSNGDYAGDLKNGDKVLIEWDNTLSFGNTRPWCIFVDKVKYNGTDEFVLFNKFVSVGLEYASSGNNRALF